MQHAIARLRSRAEKHRASLSETKAQRTDLFAACTPFGAAGGYVTVTLAYLLSHAGVSVAAIADWWPSMC
jgi:hypothetical protein